MGKLKNNQSGFSAVEAVLILVIVGLIAFVGVYISKAMKNTNNSYSSASTTSNGSSPKFAKATKKSATANATYTDTSKTYTVSYPSTWTTSQAGTGDLEGNSATLLDTMSTGFAPPSSPTITTNATVPNSVHATAFMSGDTKSIIATYSTGNGQTTPQSVTINGYQAFYLQSTQSGSGAYTDDTYAVTHNGVTVVFDFREKQAAQSVGDVAAFDASDTVPSFTSLVKSIKFLN